MIERMALLTLQYSAFHPVLDNKISNCDLEDKSAVKTPTPTPAAFSQPPNSNALDAPPREDSQAPPNAQGACLAKQPLPICSFPSHGLSAPPPHDSRPVPSKCHSPVPMDSFQCRHPKTPIRPLNPHLIAIAHAPFR